MARLLLGIPALSVASERTFSKAKLIDTRLRTSLGDEIFADLVFISKNLPEDSDLNSFIKSLQQLGKQEETIKRLFDDIEDIEATQDDDSE